MEYKGFLVKPKPWWLRVLPMSSKTCLAVYPYIYVPSQMYINIQKDGLDVSRRATMEHEVTHLERIKKTGILKFALLYFFSPSFRYQEEFEAQKANIRIWKEAGKKYPIEHYAKWLSSWLYFWCVKYDKVYKDLDEVVRNS